MRVLLKFFNFLQLKMSSLTGVGSSDMYAPISSGDDEPPPSELLPPKNTTPQKKVRKIGDDIFTKLIDFILENRIQLALFVLILAGIWYYKNNQELSVAAPKTS
jgi:hypothetical protein